MSGDTGIVIMSPHRDDAAFSCGVLLVSALERMSVSIVNVFTRSGYAPFDTAVEQVGVEVVTQLRLEEDEAAFGCLRDTAMSGRRPAECNLGLLDAPLRLDLMADSVQGDVITLDDYGKQVEALASRLQPMLEHAAGVLLPLGLGGTGLDGHIDHRIARDAGRRCAAPDRIAFYEDLPYAARMEDLIRETAIGAFLSTLTDVQPLCIQRPNAGVLKAKLASFYSSQIDLATVEEMANYTQDRRGECIYAAGSVRKVLEDL